MMVGRRSLLVGIRFPPGINTLLHVPVRHPGGVLIDWIKQATHEAVGGVLVGGVLYKPAGIAGGRCRHACNTAAPAPARAHLTFMAVPLYAPATIGAHFICPYIV